MVRVELSDTNLPCGDLEVLFENLLYIGASIVLLSSLVIYLGNGDFADHL